MMSFSFLLAVAIACIKNTESVKPAPEPLAAGVNKTLILQLVNDARKKGCQCGTTWYPPAPTISWNDLLEKAALNHSKDIAQNNYYSHTSPKGDYGAV